MWAWLLHFPSVGGRSTTCSRYSVPRLGAASAAMSCAAGSSALLESGNHRALRLHVQSGQQVMQGVPSCVALSSVLHRLALERSIGCRRLLHMGEAVKPGLPRKSETCLTQKEEEWEECGQLPCGCIPNRICRHTLVSSFRRDSVPRY